MQKRCWLACMQRGCCIVRHRIHLSQRASYPSSYLLLVRTAAASRWLEVADRPVRLDPPAEALSGSFAAIPPAAF